MSNGRRTWLPLGAACAYGFALFGGAHAHDLGLLSAGVPPALGANDVGLLTEGDVSGPLDARIAALQRETRSAEASVPAWIALGDALMQKAREAPGMQPYAEARTAFEQAIRRAPTNTQAMLGLAWVHNSLHEFDRGKRWAQQALAFKPSLQDAHALLGDAALELGEYDAAFEHYQAALDLHPSLGSYSRAAHLLWLTGEPKRAHALMRKAIAAGGPYTENTAWCRAELSRMLVGTGALDLADEEAATALLEAPDNPRVLATMGRIRTAQGRLADATAFYERAAARWPQHEALAALVDLYALTGRARDAEVAYARVLAFHAGMIHAELGDIRNAREYFSRALSLDPNFHPTQAVQAAAKLELLSARDASR